MNQFTICLKQTKTEVLFCLRNFLPEIIIFRRWKRRQGYLIEDGLIPFTIIENHDWEKPFIVESKDRPAKGRIYIQKNDSVTGKGISGVKFEDKGSRKIFVLLTELFVWKKEQ